jgi:cysteine-rich repeat protein
MKRSAAALFGLLLAGCDTLLELDAGKPKPSAASEACGDGLVALGEGCDDGDASPGDGCDGACKTERGFVCVGAPSTCSAPCGDGIVATSEGCDDGGVFAGDGCDASCAAEHGFSCDGEPSSCASLCGDGLVAPNEACDDGGTQANDGCDGSCGAELGFACSGEPSACGPVCGDGAQLGDETCDDGNTLANDCCAATCSIEAGCEIEPNDSAAAANALISIAIAGAARGNVTPSGDRDWFRFDVPTGTVGALAAHTSDGGTSTCAGGDIDTTLALQGDVALASDDDGGDGACSAITRGALAPGAYFLEVGASPSAAVSTFGYALVTTLSFCGDGVVTGSETCDDGNALAADGCNTACQSEAAAEAEPNDVVAAASGPFTPYVVISGSIASPSDVDVLALELPGPARLTLASFDGAGAPSCAAGTNTHLALLDGSGITLLAAAGNGGPGACAAIDGATAPNLGVLDAGRYYALVSAEAGSGPFNYTVVATLLSLCGDGVVEGSEECEGPSACDADCQRVPTCGDGHVDAPELCDDGNAAGGDGCGASCLFEEVEPNGSPAEASARASLFPALLVQDDALLHGALTPAGDTDLFRIDLAAPAVLRAELSEGTSADCATIQVVLELLDAAGLLLDTDTSSGLGSCGALTYALAAGTYYAAVSEAGLDDVVADYALTVELVAETAESEPNDTTAQSDTLAATSIAALGAVPLASDADYFALTLPAGASLRAEIIEGSAELCKQSEIDSVLDVYGPNGALLASDGDDGRGLCSLVDGRGASPLDPGLHALAAGVYTLRVGAGPFASGAGATFPYRLVVTTE